MTLETTGTQELSEDDHEIIKGDHEELFKKEVEKNLIEKEKERARLENERDKVFYLHTPHITNFDYKGFNYQHSKRKIFVTREPNDLFVKYRITDVGDLDEIVYVVNKQIKKFDDFKNKISERGIREIHVYFVKYNDTPLYLNILPNFDESNGPVSEFNLLSYKLDNKGEWQKASHYAYLFQDLNDQAYNLNMFRCFDIEKTETQCDEKRLYKENSLCITYHPYGNFKFYKHTYKSGNPITKFFLYRNRLLKNVIVENAEINEVDVYYHKDDKDNRLPLVITAHKKDKHKEYFVNEGTNYRWKLHADFKNYADSNEFFEKKLVEMRNDIMGRTFELDIEDYFEDLDDDCGDFKGLDVCVKEYQDIGYRAIKYTHGKSRFSISKLTYVTEALELPHVPLYSLEALYVFHHASGTYPFFLCAVYESKEDHIYVWYQLKRPTLIQPEPGSKGTGKSTRKIEKSYEVSYLLSDDPADFIHLRPIIHIIESQHYVFEIDLVKNLAESHNYTGRRLTNIEDHNFQVWHQPLHFRHHKYVITPAFSNYFTLKSASIYGEQVICDELRSSKEIYIFEHANLHHYKVCISTATYNYLEEVDEVTYNWFEIRKSTNKNTNWAVVGKPAIRKTPDEFNNPKDIDVLMNEDVAYDPENADVWYVEPKYPVSQGEIPIKYNTCPRIIYDPNAEWPPIPPDPIMKYVPAKDYTAVKRIDEKGTIWGTTTNLPGKMGGMTPLVGGLIGSGAGVGLFTVTTGYVLYTNMGNITQVLTGFIH